MLDVNNVLPTLYNDRKMKKFTSIEIFSVENTIEKEQKKRKIFSKQMCVSSQKHRMKKEEGATAAASHLPSPWRNSVGWSRKGRTGRDSPRRFILQ